MHSFTDEALKRLRSELADLLESRQNPSISLSGNEAKALIARLEASEKLNDAFINGSKDTVEYRLDKWCKSRGEL